MRRIAQLTFAVLIIAVGFEATIWRLPSWLVAFRARRLNSQCEHVRTGMSKASVLTLVTAYESSYFKEAPDPQLVFQTAGSRCTVLFDQATTTVNRVESGSVIPDFGPQ